MAPTCGPDSLRPALRQDTAVLPPQPRLPDCSSHMFTDLRAPQPLPARRIGADVVHGVHEPGRGACAHLHVAHGAGQSGNAGAVALKRRCSGIGVLQLLNRRALRLHLGELDVGAGKARDARSFRFDLSRSTHGWRRRSLRSWSGASAFKPPRSDSARGGYRAMRRDEATRLADASSKVGPSQA